MARSHSLCRSLSWKEPSVKSSSSHQNPSKQSLALLLSLWALPAVFLLLFAFSQYLKSLDRYELLYFSSSSLLPLQHLHYCISLHQSEVCFIIWLFLGRFVRLSNGLSSGLVFTFFCIRESILMPNLHKHYWKWPLACCACRAFSLRNSSPQIMIIFQNAYGFL